jgi:hypothetical protein
MKQIVSSRLTVVSKTKEWRHDSNHNDERMDG